MARSVICLLRRRVAAGFLLLLFMGQAAAPAVHLYEHLHDHALSDVTCHHDDVPRSESSPASADIAACVTCLLLASSKIERSLDFADPVRQFEHVAFTWVPTPAMVVRAVLFQDAAPRAPPA